MWCTEYNEYRERIRLLLSNIIRSMKKNILSKKYISFFLSIIVIGLGYWYMHTRPKTLPDGVETGVVEHGDVIEEVTETGYVQPTHAVNLAFERGGKVTSILVHEGDVVSSGDVLMTTEATQQKTDILLAQSRLQAEEARLHELVSGADDKSRAVTESSVVSVETLLENAKQNLADVIAQQNQLVSNAEKTLRSTGLQAYLISDERSDSPYSYVSPTITGTYHGTEDGVYRVALYDSNAPSGSSYRVTGLEIGTDSVSTISPSPIGSRGLYLQFPDNFAKRTEWEIPIPNTRSSSYLTNLNAYHAVVETRNLAVASAENAVKSAEAQFLLSKSQLTQVVSSARDERVNAQRALVEQMHASLSQAQVAYENTIIKAPFAGVVTAVNADVGQIITAGIPVLSISSKNDFELTVNISEVDIAEVSVGDTAVVTFDAYDGKTFTAVVTKVAPNATVVSGVRIFEVTLAFDKENEMIKDGLTTEITITTATRHNVIAIPTRAIYENKEGKFVRVIQNGTEVSEVPITTGLRGSNGMTEVLSGLSGGEPIITFANEQAIAKIKQN